MTERIVRTERDRAAAMEWIRRQPLPLTLKIQPGAKRSLEQNRLQRQWLLEAQAQGDQTAEEYRAYCKLHIGVPILRAENDDFCEQYDRVVKPLPYEAKLELMQEPIDFPVTRLMTRAQKSRYLDAMFVELCSQGLALTEPSHAA